MTKKEIRRWVYFTVALLLMVVFLIGFGIFLAFTGRWFGATVCLAVVSVTIFLLWPNQRDFDGY